MRPSKLRKSVLGTLGLFGAALPAAAHDLTPTTIFEVPVQLDPQSGSILFALLIGPPPGENIWHARLELNWFNAGPTPASEFSIDLSSQVVGGPSPSWVVTGAQLGWGAAAGMYSTVVESDLLNGEAAPFSVIHVEVAAASGGGLWGQLTNSKLVLELAPHMASSVGAISLSGGGTQPLELNAGPLVGAGKPYLVLGTTSGSMPGFDFSAVHVPLNVDAYTLFSLSNPNSALLASSFGLLDAMGRGNAFFKLPAGTDPSLSGTIIDHAFALIDAASATVLSASNAVRLVLTP